LTQLDRNVGVRLALLLRGPISRGNRDGLLLHCDVAVEFGLLLGLLVTHGFAIDGEEKLTFGDVLSLGEGNGSNLPRDARLDVDTLDGLNVPYGRDLKGHILRDHAGDVHGDTLRRGCIGVGHDART
jgi:hypothetical protein